MHTHARTAPNNKPTTKIHQLHLMLYGLVLKIKKMQTKESAKRVLKKFKIAGVTNSWVNFFVQSERYIC